MNQSRFRIHVGCSGIGWATMGGEGGGDRHLWMNLIRWVLQGIRQQKSPEWRGLDLKCGCGVRRAAASVMQCGQAAEGSEGGCSSVWDQTRQRQDDDPEYAFAAATSNPEGSYFGSDRGR
jgi:hypothetical protein